MFGTKKLKGPKQVTELVAKYLVATHKLAPEMARTLYMADCANDKGEKAYDCRIFDDNEPQALNIKIENYLTFNEHPELVLYEGWYDEKAKTVELAEKRRLRDDIPLFTKEQIQQKIEALKEPGSTVYFYQARGPAVGGPLGRGAALVELTPAPEGKKVKKYTIYTVNVVGMEPVGNKSKLFDENDAKKAAVWVADAHHRRGASSYGA